MENALKHRVKVKEYAMEASHSCAIGSGREVAPFQVVINLGAVWARHLPMSTHCLRILG